MSRRRGAGRVGRGRPGAPARGNFSLDRHLEDIRRAMEEVGGVQRRAAELLGYGNYQNLAAQLERLGLKETG